MRLDNGDKISDCQNTREDLDKSSSLKSGHQIGSLISRLKSKLLPLLAFSGIALSGCEANNNVRSSNPDASSQQTSEIYLGDAYEEKSLCNENTEGTNSVLGKLVLGPLSFDAEFSEASIAVSFDDIDNFAKENCDKYPYIRVLVYEENAIAEELLFIVDKDFIYKTLKFSKPRIGSEKISIDVNGEREVIIHDEIVSGKATASLAQ